MRKKKEVKRGSEDEDIKFDIIDLITNWIENSRGTDNGKRTMEGISVGWYGRDLGQRDQ